MLVSAPGAVLIALLMQGMMFLWAKSLLLMRGKDWRNHDEAFTTFVLVFLVGDVLLIAASVFAGQ